MRATDGGKVEKQWHNEMSRPHRIAYIFLCYFILAITKLFKVIDIFVDIMQWLEIILLPSVETCSIQGTV